MGRSRGEKRLRSRALCEQRVGQWHARGPSGREAAARLSSARPSCQADTLLLAGIFFAYARGCRGSGVGFFFLRRGGVVVYGWVMGF